MRLAELSILNYKNIAQVDLLFASKINCFLGQNGAGKTNILDAIYYMSFCKSGISQHDVHIIRHGESSFLLQGDYIKDNDERLAASVGGKIGGRKVIKCDGKFCKKLSEHIGRIPLVMVAPSDATLVTGGSEERRRMMDIIISQYDSQYLSALIRYNKALQQRNSLLKQEDSAPIDMLELYEQMMVQESRVIVSSRMAFVQQMVPVFNELYARIGGNSEVVSLSYNSRCLDEDLAQLYERGRYKEMAVGYSLYGPHRDDFDMLLNGFPVKKEGSQGQCKTFVLALKFAQFDFLRKQEHELPILLLDDVFDKLDERRVENIMDLVSSNGFGQIFVTDTNRDHLDMILSRSHSDYKIFKVEEGDIYNAEK
jgi:DNA replication and repair protein RecF